MSIARIEAKMSEIAVENHRDDTKEAGRSLGRLGEKRAELRRAIAEKEKDAQNAEKDQQDAAHEGFWDHALDWCSSRDRSGDASRALKRAQTDEKHAEAQAKVVQGEESDQLSMINAAEHDLHKSSDSLQEMLDDQRQTASMTLA
jgi:hypothetical protein